MESEYLSARCVTKPIILIENIKNDIFSHIVQQSYELLFCWVRLLPRLLSSGADLAFTVSILRQSRKANENDGVQNKIAVVHLYENHSIKYTWSQKAI